MASPRPSPPPRRSGTPNSQRSSLSSIANRDDFRSTAAPSRTFSSTPASTRYFQNRENILNEEIAGTLRFLASIDFDRFSGRSRRNFQRISDTTSNLSYRTILIGRDEIGGRGVDRNLYTPVLLSLLLDRCKCLTE
ncbi:uncharacterized protein LOC143152715 isoform X2 [Ptiloglossa arizonensis]|uniref:uncharacterized protein LOC143152715 isoform X2 n=1 Tax=Ptiloglossa arizonensis TaxID=3350558 RepID=UPI003FA1722D